jgi:hypothetical protein
LEVYEAALISLEDRTMKRFLVLYESSVPAAMQMAKASPEQARAGMDLWMRWAQKAGSAIVDMGAPLGGARAVPGSAGAGIAGPVTGYTILQAESGQHALGVLEGHPHFHAPGASIEVLELLAMPGMPQD